MSETQRGRYCRISMMLPQAAQTAGRRGREASSTYRNAAIFSACSRSLSAASISFGRVARWAYTLNMMKLSYPFESAMRCTLWSVGSSASGAAVEGLTPMQMSGFSPRVPRMYRYSV